MLHTNLLVAAPCKPTTGCCGCVREADTSAESVAVVDTVHVATRAAAAGTKAALKGCVNDVKNMKKMLVENFGFPASNIQILVDVGGTAAQKPTGKAIKKTLRRLCKGCKPGDVLFVHFSGHGTQVRDKNGDDADNKDEAIVPTDLNVVTDDDLRRILGKLPPNVKFTMVRGCFFLRNVTAVPCCTTLRGNRQVVVFVLCCRVLQLRRPLLCLFLILLWSLLEYCAGN